jgi:hypothetical protein
MALALAHMKVRSYAFITYEHMIVVFEQIKI